MVAWLIGAAYLSAQFPGIPRAVWIMAFILITTFLNVIVIRVAARANFLLMVLQLLVLGIFVALCLAYFFREDTGARLWSPSSLRTLRRPPSRPEQPWQPTPS
jgi:putrescine importer